MEHMKAIDKHLGFVICMLVSIFDNFARLFSKNKNKKNFPEVNRILFVKFWGMGSIILSSPLIRAVRQKYPKAKIIFLTFSTNKEICELIGLIDEVVYLERSNFYRFFLDTIKILARLRREKIDIVFDLEFFARFPSIITYLSGGEIKVEFHSELMWRGNFPKIKVPFNFYYHNRENFLNLAREIGIEGGCLELEKIKIPKVVSESIEKVLLSKCIDKDSLLIGVNVNASDLAIERRWPKENYARLVAYLVGKYNSKVVFVGAKHDVPYVADTLNLLPSKENVVNLAGKIGIKELAAFLKKCDLFISNDSGPLHLAVALGTPTVSFFGPETPVLYGPLGDYHLCFFKNMVCSPCLSVHNLKTIQCNKEVECLRSISVEEVITSIEQSYGVVLNKRSFKYRETERIQV